MNEDPNKRVNRRRRRPDRGGRRPNDAPPSPPPSAGGPAGPEAPANPSGGRPPRGGANAGGSSAGGARSGGASSGGGRREESGNAVLHRRTEHRRGERPGQDASSSGLEVHPGLMAVGKNRGANEEPISPINKNIFIYTYTLRPRALLDSYQPPSGVTHRMQFENMEEPD